MSLNRFRTTVVVDDDVAVLRLSQKLGKMGKSEQRPFFAGSPKSGYFYLFADEKMAPGLIMETVMSAAGDSISTLYSTAGCPWFATPGELTRARDQMVTAMCEKVGLSVEAMGIDDAARGRSLGPFELAFAQMIDLMTEETSSSVAVSDTHHQTVPL